MLSRILVVLSIFTYFSPALWNPFVDKNINLNKDLVNKLIFVKKEKARLYNYTKEEIAFLKKYNLTLGIMSINKIYVLNIIIEKSLSTSKRAIAY